MGWATLCKLLVWMLGLYGSTLYSLHSIYFVVSGIIFIFSNLGHRQPGSLSAYSVFNDNFERLHGTMDPMSLFSNREPPQTGLVVEQGATSVQPSLSQEYFKNQSKYGNKPCVCGSGMKFKKCCLVAQRRRQEEQRGKGVKETKAL